MLPADHRMRRSQDYAAAVRRGRRSGRSTLVAHLAAVDADQPTRVGFVVSRAVGGAVTRNVVRRRLRELARHRLDRIGGGRLLVIRALPRAATATQAELGSDLDHALDSLRSPSRNREGVAERRTVREVAS